MILKIDKILADFDLEFIGSEKGVITNVGSTKRSDNESILWAKTAKHLGSVKKGNVLCNSVHLDQIDRIPDVNYLVTKSSPRLIFAKIVSQYFSRDEMSDFDNFVEEHRIVPSLTIGHNVFIGKNVIIGKGTKVHHNVVILPNTTIGENCVVYPNTTIGTEGLGLEMDPDTGRYFKFPQIGGVHIEDEVEIGPHSTIRRSALDDTIIMSGTKIGSLCNVGHNCIIGKNCILTSNVVLSGSSRIGDEVFMGVSSTVKQGVNIESGVTIGQGAVVVKNVPVNETWVGNPAKKIK